MSQQIAVDFSGLTLSGVRDVELTVTGHTPVLVTGPANTNALALSMATALNISGITDSASSGVLTLSGTTVPAVSVQTVSELATASASVIDLSGVSLTGLSSVVLELDGQTYSMAVSGSTTRADVANGLAALVTDAGTNYTATSSGNTITLDNTASAAAVVATVVGKTPQASLVQGRVQVIDFGAVTWQRGATYTVTLASPANSFSTVANSADASIGDVAGRLASAIDGNATYTASLVGNRVLITQGAASSTVTASSLGVSQPVSGSTAVTVSTGTKTGAATVVDLTGVAAVNGATYQLKVGDQTYNHTAGASETLASIAGALRDLVAASTDPDTATVRNLTVNPTWTSVLGELKRQIEAGERIGVTVNSNVTVSPG